MNRELAELARRIDLGAPGHARLRLRFGLSCGERVRHFLTDPLAAAALDALAAHLEHCIDAETLAAYATETARLANRHPGSPSLDGCGHAAVSATYAVASALAGEALRAAEYAAYATVYGEGGYGAVCDPASFAPEYAWQVDCLAALAQATAP